MLVVTLLVRDEEDVIAANLEHHLAQGTDMVIVTDNGSQDGTVDILQQYARAGVVHLIHEPAANFDQSAWVTRMARLAASHYGANWVVNADADEFWQPIDQGSTLRETLSLVPAGVDRVIANRINLVGPFDDAVPWSLRLVYRDLESLSERGTPLGPKVCHRASEVVSVAMGNHDVGGDDLGLTAVAELIEILHVPMRSYAQYARKIANGGSSLERNSALSVETGWHWRADLERLRDGTLRAAYRERLPTQQTLDGSPGRFLRDDSLRQRLERRLGTSVAPVLLQRGLEI